MLISYVGKHVSKNYEIGIRTGEEVEYLVINEIGRIKKGMEITYKQKEEILKHRAISSSDVCAACGTKMEVIDRGIPLCDYHWCIQCGIEKSTKKIHDEPVIGNSVYEILFR